MITLHLALCHGGKKIVVFLAMLCVCVHHVCLFMVVVGLVFLVAYHHFAEYETWSR